MESKFKWIHNVRVTARDLDGNILDVQNLHNLITTVGLGMIIDGLDGDVSDFEIKYMGVGDDNTAPAIGQTALVNETFRKATTSTSQPTASSMTHVTYIAPAEAVGTIEELGWFAGAAAGAGADSGIMIARALYSRNKTNLESVQVERTDTIAEG